MGKESGGVLSGTIGETSLRKGHRSGGLGWGRKSKRGRWPVQRHRGGQSSEPERQLCESQAGQHGNEGRGGGAG